MLNEMTTNCLGLTYDFFELPLLTPAKAGGSAFDIFGFIILVLKVWRISSWCAS